MCQFKTLYHQPNKGFMCRCDGCGTLQLGFGNVLVMFHENGLANFISCVTQVLHLAGDGFGDGTRGIVLPTPCPGTQLLLNQQELRDLSLLLDEADSELKARSLLDLFKA